MFSFLVHLSASLFILAVSLIPRPLNGYLVNKLLRIFIKCFILISFFRSDLSVGDLLSMPIDHITDVDQQLLPVSEILIPPEIVDPVQVESPSAPVSVVAIESKEQTQAAPTNDTVPSVSLNASRTNDSGANEADDIPSFNEWTQKVLAEEEKSGLFITYWYHDFFVLFDKAVHYYYYFFFNFRS